MIAMADRVFDLSKNAEFLNEKFSIPKLLINGMEFKNVKGISVNTPQGIVFSPDSIPPHSMMIGLDLFKGKAVLIDYQKQRLSVADNTQTLGINMTDGWISLPLQLTPEGVEIKVVKIIKNTICFWIPVQQCPYFLKNGLNLLLLACPARES
ncbi:Uncharacterised protein [Yersinia kristensenii]|nr:hypothetical protein ykris0001_1170 [Yersinia kristensenii ATCC 33638]SUP70520.1 Uncharacterised protein [Yersinia kristensenii]